MHLLRNIHNFFSLAIYFAVVFDLSHGIEVHTDDVVKAEYGASITIPCTYTPRSSRSNFQQVLWKRGGNPIIYVDSSYQDSTKVSDRYSLSVDFVSSGNLTINNVVIDDEGTYTCAVSVVDSLEKLSSSSLEVTAAPRELLLRGQAANNPVVIHQNAVTLKPGVDVEFECQAVRSRPAVTIKWYYAGALVEPLSSPSPSSDDVGFQNTTSSFAIARPSRTDHGESLVCQAVMMDGRVVRITSIIINVEEPPDQPIDIHGLAYPLTSSTRHELYCIAGSSFPSSEITWSLDEENLTDNAEVTTTNMASGYVRVISKLSYVTKREDYGKILRCRVSHVALREDVVAEKAICLIDTEMNLSSVEGDLSGSLFLEVSGIPHSASCSLSACNIAQDNSTTRDECPERYLGDTFSDCADHVYEFNDLVASTTYDVSLRCVHTLCGESTTETRATVPSPPDRGGKNIDSENVHFENMNSEFNAESNSSTVLVWNRPSGLNSGASAGIAFLAILLVASLIINIVQFTLLRRRTKPEFDGSKMNEKRDEVNTPQEVNDSVVYEMIQSGNRAYTPLQLDSSHSFIIARENVTFFTILGSIGRGDFGEVWKGDLRSNQHHLDVAIRQIPDRVIKSLQVLESIKVLYNLSDQPNIVKCLGYCEEQGSILYEFISGGTLLTRLQTSGVQSQPTYTNLKPKGVRIDEGTLLNLAWQVAKGMQFLASKKIIHGALCAHNVLLGERKQCKISDYGLSSSLFGDLAKPTRWSSPETMATNDQTKEGDIWSFGIVLWEIVTLGARPYPEMTFTTVQTEVAKGYQMQRPHHCAQEVYAIMSSCWKKDPTSRTNFDRILKDLERILRKTHSYLSLNDLDERVYASTLDL